MAKNLNVAGARRARHFEQGGTLAEWRMVSGANCADTMPTKKSEKIVILTCTTY